MEVQEFKSKALQVTLKCIDEHPENWRTFNDQIHTILIDGKRDTFSEVTLGNGELPILECVLDKSFVLITTKRILSSISDENYEMPLIDVTGLSDKYESDNYKVVNDKRPKTNLILVLGKEGAELPFIIDSYHPAFFVKILIQNLSCFLTSGEWYLNPSRDWKPNSPT